MESRAEITALKDVLVPDWPAPAGVQALTTVRGLPGASPPPFEAFNLGDRCGDDPAAVAANRAALVKVLPAAPHWLRQVHGIEVHTTVSGTPPIEPPRADAAYADAPGIVLSVLTADCLPVLVCSDNGAEIAVIHAGWRGLAAGVIEAGVARFSAPRERLLVWLGPAIGAVSYEVGMDVRDAFVAQDDGAKTAFVPTQSDRWYCDLYRLARRRLAAVGVNRVYGGNFDTFTDARFYSHRRDGSHSGRFASLIWRKP